MVHIHSAQQHVSGRVRSCASIPKELEADFASRMGTSLEETVYLANGASGVATKSKDYPKLTQQLPFRLDSAKLCNWPDRLSRTAEERLPLFILAEEHGQCSGC